VHRITLALVAGAALLSGSAAFAADLSVPRPPPLAPALTWTGCYVGGFIGRVWAGDVRATAAVAPDDDPGARYSYPFDNIVTAGGALGCDIQFGWFAFGAEGEAGYLRLRGSDIDPNSVVSGNDTLDSTRIGDWYGVIAGRFGAVFGPALVYIKGGGAFVEVSSTIVDTCAVGACSPRTLAATGSADDWTWALGGGIEYAFSPNWSMKVEYLRLGLGSDYNVCGPGGGDAAGSTLCSTHNVDGIHSLKFGVNFRFGGPYGGVVGY
jgi:outer membrane immunogenic protein